MLLKNQSICIQSAVPAKFCQGIKIIIMNEGNDSDQQCFIPARWEDPLPDVVSPSLLSINRLLPSANDLQKISKPVTLKPRTCLIEMGMTKLPPQLDQGYCIDQSTTSQKPSLSIKNIPAIISQRAYSNFEDFASSFEEVFDKMRKYKQQIFSFHQLSSRFKQIAPLSDYHEALFQELKQHEPTPHKQCDIFESAFQCGNLGKVYKVPDQRQYILLLENDVNSHGYASWFFFRVQPAEAGSAQFHILNLAKQPYMHRLGMKIAVFSKLRYQQEGIGWHWGGYNIQAYSTGFQKKNKPSENYYGLSFNFNFSEHDEVYFAFNQPYTYSRAIRQLQSLTHALQKAKISVQIIRSITSICYNVIPILQIRKQATDQDNKKTIVIMARQHPGQVVGSFIMDAIMKKIESLDQNVLEMLDRFNIVLIPMVNPDGVIHGNSRCNLAGLDLNRNWNQQIKGAVPETMGLRKYLWNLHSVSGIHMLVDLHGHSKKMNSFLFCSKPEVGEPNYFFPFLLSKIQSKFDFSSCTFSSTPDKKNTLRCQLNREGMLHCYTLESSYFGFWEAPNCPKAFSEQDFDQIGESLCLSIKLISFYKQTQILKIAQLKIHAPIENFFQQMKRATDKIKFQQAQHSDDWAELQSESDPEGDIINSDEMESLLFNPVSNDRKSSISKKNILTRKSKTTKKKAAKNDDDPDDIRRSQPTNPESLQVKNLTKYHRSEKKINPPASKEKPVNNQTKFYSHVRPKKNPNMADVKQKVIHTNNLTIGNSKGQQTEIKSKVVYSTFYVQPLNEKQYNKIKRPKAAESRLRSEAMSYDPPKAPHKKMEMTKELIVDLKKDKFSHFLDNTLQISKVDNPSATSNNFIANNQKPEVKLNSSSSFSHWAKNKTLTEEFLEQGESTKRKTQHGINFQKELMKRKKKLMAKLDSGKYQRFQNFKTEQDLKTSSIKPQANSVFYYFPVL